MSHYKKYGLSNSNGKGGPNINKCGNTEEKEKLRELLETDSEWDEIVTLIPAQVINQIDGKQKRILKQNEHWGDNIENEKAKNTFRVYFQNVNGVCKRGDWEEVECIMKEMKRMKVDMFGFVETNVAWTKQNIAHVQQIGRRILGDRKMEMTSSDEEALNIYQPGGTLVAAVGKHAGRVLESGNDSHGMGRWSYLCLTGKGIKIYVVVAYRVAQINNDGIHTSFLQQYRLMRRRGVSKPNPRKQWCEDLLQAIKGWRKEGDVLLLTDANSALNDKEFGPFVAEAGLYDILGHLHGVGGTNSHIKGQQRITFALGTRRLVKTTMAAGMLPFHAILASDHRAIHLEMNELHLFRGEIHEIQRQVGRKVSNKHQKTAKKYREAVTAKVEMCDLRHKIRTQLEKTLRGEEINPIEEMEKLDAMLQNIMVETEKEMPQIPRFWWSEPLHKAFQIVIYWRKAHSFWKNGIDGEEQLREMEMEIGTEYDVTYGEKGKTTRGFLRRAQKELRQLRNNSKKTREEWQVKAAEEEEKKDPKSRRATILRVMREKEDNSIMWATMKRYMGQGNEATLTHLLVPDYDRFKTSMQKTVAFYTEAGEIEKAHAVSVIYQMMHNYKLGLEKNMPHKRVVIKEEMEDHLLSFHRRHFRQAEETPFAKAEMAQLLGYCGDTEFAEQLRDGTADISCLPTDAYTKDFLSEMKHNANDPPSVSDELKLRDVTQGFKLWNEQTSTSPLGNHLGLYKTWFKTPKQNKDNEEDELTTTQFFTMITDLLRMALHLMAPKQRWKIVHNLFLLKETGNFKISRMRTIHKIDAELNLIRRNFLAHKTMHNAERHHHLDDAQYGGRKGRTAIDPVVIKVLAIETAHLQRSNMGITDCDAKACYDRIVPSVSALLETKAGAPRKISTLFAKILQLMQYFPATGKGVGDKYNTHQIESPIFGSGQGAADAPFKWTIIDNTIIKLFRRWAIGRMIQDTLKTIREKRDNIMFVDDQTLLHNLMRMFAVSCFALMGIIQYDVTLWGRYLWVSGGWLEYSKTQYCVMIWAFKANGVPYLLPEEELPPNNVVIKGADGSNTMLQRTDVNKAVKMLGARHAATLQQTTEFKYLLGKTVKFGCAIIACPLRPHQVKICYHAIYMSSVTYSMPSTSLNNIQCDNIQKALTTKILPRLGYHRNFPQSIVYGPSLMGGVGLLTIAGEQAVAKISTVVMHLRANTAVGREFLISLSWAQVQTGVGTNLLVDTRPIPHMDGKYLCHLRECLHKLSAKIVIPQLPRLRIERQNDQFIMDIFLDSDYVAADDQQELNGCRLFLKAATLAHITTSDGRRIRRECFEPTRIPDKVNIPELEGRWPRQEKPASSAWATWKKTLIKMVCNQEGILHTRLGAWFIRSNRWTTYSTGKYLYRRIAQKWTQHRRIKTTRHGTMFEQRPRSIVEIPKGAPITDLQHKDGRFLTSNITPVVKNPINEKTSETWEQYISTLEEWEQQLLNNLEECQHGYVSLRLLLQMEEQIWLVSDGGLDEGTGYFGWVVASDRQILWENRGHATGHPTLIETLRTESIGTLSIMVFMKHYIHFHDIKWNPSMVVHWCDNMGVVRRLAWGELRSVLTPGECLHADADVILQIEQIYRDLGNYFVTRHVKGHQDDDLKKQDLISKLKGNDTTGRKKQLAWEAKLNIRADKLAGKAKNEITARQKKAPAVQYPACNAHLIIGDKLVTRKMKQEIRTAWNIQDLRKEYKTRFKWKNSTFDKVDWETVQRTMKRQNFYTHRFLVKLVNKRLAVRGEKYSAMEEKNCPCCGKARESNHHFLQCTMNPESWDGLVELLSEIFKKYNVDPVLRILINYGVQQKRISGAQKRYGEIQWDEYQPVIREQSEIGWSQLVYGRFSRRWQKRQQMYCKKMDEVTYEEGWLDAVVLAIWKFTQLRWKARNSALHGDKSNYAEEKKILLQRMKGLYNRQHEMLATDRRIFNTSLDTWENSSVTDIRRWILTNQPFITACVRLKMEQEKKKSQDIRSFYIRKQNSPRSQKGKTDKSKNKNKGRKTDKQNKSHQGDIRTMLLKWDQEMCRDHEAEERNIQRGITGYYSIQDKPPDDSQRSVQIHIDEFLGTSPKDNSTA